MRLPRMTTRRWIIVVMATAVVMWMAVIAYRVENDSSTRYVHHLWVRKDIPEGLPRWTVGTVCVPPFWSQYWRRLLGQTWPDTYTCHCADPRYAVNGATSQFFDLVGSRAGPSDSLEPMSALLDAYNKRQRDRSEP
jgi:hypothetical protein